MPSSDAYLARAEELHRREPTTGFVLGRLHDDGSVTCEVTVEPPITQFAAFVVDGLPEPPIPEADTRESGDSLFGQ